MIYRFKIWFEDEEDIIRWIDMKPSHSFKDFHTAILQSIQFEDKEPSSFYLANDRWIKGFEITLMDMGMDESEDPKTLMQDCLLRDFINDPHQKFIYVHDFLQMWTLHIELQSIQEPNPKVTYPFVFKSEGVAPKQNIGSGKFNLLDDTDFDAIADQLLREKGGPVSDIGNISDFIDEEDFDEEDEEEDDEFGPSYGDGFEEGDSKDYF